MAHLRFAQRKIVWWTVLIALAGLLALLATATPLYGVLSSSLYG